MLPKIRFRIFLTKTLNIVDFDDQIFTFVLAMPIIIKIHNSEGAIWILFEKPFKIFQKYKCLQKHPNKIWSLAC